MYIDQFTDYLRLERNYSPRTVASYRRDLVLFQGFLKETDPELDLLTADRDVVRLWVVEMMEKGEKSTTVNRKLSTLRSFYRFLRIKGITDKSPDGVFVVNEVNREAITTGLSEGGYDSAKVATVASFQEAMAALQPQLKAGDVVLYENDLPDSFK